MKFLLVKSSSFGDILQSMRALSYLRYKAPYAQIDWVVEQRCAELILPHPEVDNAIIIESKRLKCPKLESYDVVFDLQGNCKSAWILSRVRAKIKFGFGRSHVSEWPNLLFTNKRVILKKGQNVREEYLQLVQAYFKEQATFNEIPFLYRICEEEEQFLRTLLPDATLICPFSRWKNKEIKKEQLIDIITKRKGPFYFIWQKEEERAYLQELASSFAAVHLLPKLSLPLLQRVMDKVSLVISADSLALHLAATTKTPTLSYFGPSSAQKYAPVGEGHSAVQGSCPYGVSFERRCPQLRSCQTAACMSKSKSI